MVTCSPWWEPSPDMNHAVLLILDLTASRTRENKFLSCMPLSLCFVMPDWVKTNGRYSVIYSYEIYIINKILHSNKKWTYYKCTHLWIENVLCKWNKPATKEYFLPNEICIFFCCSVQLLDSSLIPLVKNLPYRMLFLKLLRILYFLLQLFIW